MQDDDNLGNYLCGLEAWEILRPASDYLLQMITSGQIDLNDMARQELRARRQHEATKRIAAMEAGAP